MALGDNDAVSRRGRAKAGTTGARGRNAQRTRGAGARREKEVIDAATKVFHARGYADASVQDIADELGILKGSLYHYIDSKEDLLFRVLEESHDEVDGILATVRALPDLTPLERLAEYTRRQVEFTCRNLAKMAVYYHDGDQLSRQRLRQLQAKRHRHEDFVTTLIAEAQKRGEVNRKLDAQIATNFLFGSMIWIYRWYRPGGPLRPGQIGKACADFVLKGVIGAPRAPK